MTTTSLYRRLVAAVDTEAAEAAGVENKKMATSILALIDVNKPFKMINDDSYGTKRAVMIGINYVGQQGELSGCHNDVTNMT